MLTFVMSVCCLLAKCADVYLSGETRLLAVVEPESTVGLVHNGRALVGVGDHLHHERFAEG